MTPEEMRMDAYYYHFERTGNEAIDKVLSAIAHAGKAFHNTADWNDECDYTPKGLEGKTPVEWIQNAANEATTELATLKKEVERLQRENRRRAACDLVNDQFKRSIENHEEREGRLKDELATLKGEAERLKDVVAMLNGEKRIMLDSLISKYVNRTNQMLKAYPDGSVGVITPDEAINLLIDTNNELATLRTRLDALVTAGEKGVDAYCALCDVLSDLPTCIEDIVEDYQTHSDNIDALAAAVREAKGEK